MHTKLAFHLLFKKNTSKRQKLAKRSVYLLEWFLLLLKDADCKKGFSFSYLNHASFLFQHESDVLGLGSHDAHPPVFPRAHLGAIRQFRER